MNAIQILLQARDQASTQIQKVNAELKGLQATASAGSTSMAAFAGGAAIAASAVAAIGAAAVRMTFNLAAQEEELNNARQAAGLARDEYRALLAVFEDAANVSGQELAMGLRSLNSAIEDGNPLLQRLGVTSKDTRTALGQLADAYSKIRDGAFKSDSAQELLGRSGRRLIGVLNQGSAAIAAQVDEMKLYQKAVEENADALTKLDDVGDRIGRQWEGLANQMIASLAPAILAVATQISKLLDGMSKLVELVKKAPWLLLMFAGNPVAGIGQMLNFANSLGKAGAGGGSSGGGGGNEPPGAPGGARKGITYGDDYGPRNQTLQEIMAIGRDRGRIRREIVRGWQEVFDDLSSAANNFTTTLDAAFSGWTAGFQQVAVNLIGTTQTIRQAIVTIFRSMATEALAELGRIAGAKAFGFILNALGFVTNPFNAAGQAAGGAGIPTPANVPLPQFPNSTGNQIHIHTLNPRDVAMDLLSPFGSLRRGNDLVRVGRGY